MSAEGRWPAAIIELPLEGSPSIRLAAESGEDEQRLRAWLLGAGSVRDLGQAILETLAGPRDEA